MVHALRCPSLVALHCGSGHSALLCPAGPQECCHGWLRREHKKEFSKRQVYSLTLWLHYDYCFGVATV